MFVVIVCSQCKQSVQVAQELLGKTVECPLCRQPTIARTEAPVLPVARELPIQLEPYSLDDAPELPERPQRRPAPTHRLSTPVLAVVSLLMTAVVMGGVYLIYRVWTKSREPARWEMFEPPGGNCSVLLPTDAQEEAVPPIGFASLGGKRWVARRPGTKEKPGETETVFGWLDLDATRFKGVQFDQIVIPIRDRTIQDLKGKFQNENAVNLNAHGKSFEGLESRIEVEGGKAVMRFYLRSTEPRERIYFLWMSGPEVGPQSDEVLRYFHSFSPR